MNAEPVARPLGFAVDGVRCAGVHLAADGEAPCVVMAHGLGGTIDAGLVPYARRFAAAGYHVLMFDYRGFGTSDGEPRQVVDVSRQLDDWRAAIRAARGIAGGRDVVLWGTSLSGGHVLTLAAEDADIAAVIAQSPMVDGLASFVRGVRSASISRLLRLTARAAADSVRRGPPLLVPIYGPPGSLALLAEPDSEAGYGAIAPSGFCNQAAARFALALPRYRPCARVSRITCPVLVQICERDSVAPAGAARAAAARIPRAGVRSYPIGHFDIYTGTGFEHAVTDQLDWLRALVPAR